MPAGVSVFSGLARLSGRYDAYLVDSWGVLQDGVTAFEAANRCLRELKRRGKTIIVLSNSARRSSVVAAELAELGVAMDCVDGVLTGGETAWQALKRGDRAAGKPLGDHCYYLGSRRSRSLLDGLELQITASIDDASFILNTAPPNDLSQDALERLLRIAADRGLPLICANPDLVAYHGSERRICAGAIAARYEEIGGAVRYHGKPHGAFYREALDTVAPIATDRILAVGDSLRTDVAGAVNAGVDALFVTGGIHRDDLSDPETLPDRLAVLCIDRNVRPIGAVTQLRW